LEKLRKEKPKGNEQELLLNPGEIVTLGSSGNIIGRMEHNWKLP
jgi:hypothetical protein